MGLALTVARRSLLQHKGRSLFSILGIAVGIATVVGVITLDFNTIRGIAGESAVASRPDLEVNPGRRDAAEAAREVKELPGVAAAASYFQNDAAVRLPAGPDATLPVVTPAETGAEAQRGKRGRGSRNPEPGDADEAAQGPQKVRLFAFQAAELQSLSLHSLSSGRELSPDHIAREVLIGEPLADKLSLGLGDDLLIARPVRAARKACVDGQLVHIGPARKDAPIELSFEVVGILANEGLGHKSRARGMVAIVDYDWGTELYKGVHIVPKVWMQHDRGVNIERLETSLASTYSYEINRQVLRGQAADERAFRTGVRMAGLLAMLLGLYVIFHTLSMSLIERVGEIGCMHALGVTRSQVARIFFLEALILAGLGALFGTIGGIGLAWQLQELGITTLGSDKILPSFGVPWETVLPLAGIGFAMAIAGSIYPILLIGGANTVAALRGDKALHNTGATAGFHRFAALLLIFVLPGLYFVFVPVVGEFSKQLVSIVLSAVALLALLVVLSFLMPSILANLCGHLATPFTRWWPLAGRIASRTMRESPTRIAVSASAIALVTAAFVGLKGMTGSLRGEVEVWAHEAVVDKVWIKDLPAADFAELSRQLNKYPGVLGVEQGSVRSHGHFLLLGLDPSQLQSYGPLADDPELLRKMKRGHGMILSRRLASENQYALGDPVHVTKADGSVQEFEVVAISDAYGYFPHPDERMYGVVCEDYMQRYYCLDITTTGEVAVRLEPGADQSVVETAVMELYPDSEDINIEYGQALLAHHAMDIDRDFVLFDVLIALTAVLAALGVLNGQLLSAMERSKELGVLKALGTSRGQIAGMVFLECSVVGVVGGLVGAIMGALMTPLAVTALQELAGLALPPPAVGIWIAFALVGAALLTLLSGLYPIWRMNRLDAVRAVRTG